MDTSIPDDVSADLHDLYRHLHRHPELSMQEHKTAALIEERLRDLTWAAFRCGGTGVVGVLENGPGPVVAFRADTDALPIAEATGLDYASTDTGQLPDGTTVPVMHACGHDTHVTAALGAARLLADRRDQWSGTVVLIFQPGEETAAGAAAMVEDGLWDKAPRPTMVLGQHLSPREAGTIHLPSGPAMAMADAWEVTVHGRGGHGSRPESTIDPVVLAAHMVVRLQSIVAREVGALSAAVVTVGTFHAGLKENIISDRAVFTVNVRSLDEDVRERVLSAIRRVIAGEAQASGAPEPQIRPLYRFPLMVNDPDTTERIGTALRAELGETNVSPAPPMMGSEDFGHLAEAIGVPSVYWFFGGLEASTAHGNHPPSNHSPDFAPVLEPTLTTAVRAALAGISQGLDSSR